MTLLMLIGFLNILARSDFLTNLAEQLTGGQFTGSLKRKGAAIGAVIAFTGFASIHYPNTIMVRPHPIFWRAIMGLFTVYAMVLTYLFLMDVDEVRETLRFFDSELGKPLEEFNYGADCRVFTPENPESQFANLKDAVIDCHFVAHFLGWLGKMLIMRDWYVAWICSFGFEFLELTFRHWLANFYECWWDSLLLDLFGCNLLGIIAGNYILKYMSVSKIDWLRGKEVQTQTEPTVTCDNMVVNFATKLMPAALEKYEWSGL